MPEETAAGNRFPESPTAPGAGAKPELSSLTDIPQPQAIGPTQPDERITLIDVLRGVALIGIIVANMRGFAGPMPAYMEPGLIWKSRLDWWVQAFIDTFIQGKFITIFSFLFGVGFVLQFTRAEKRHARFGRFYSRRLSALLLIGAVHQFLFWWGDVLVTYALGGFCLIPFRKRTNKTILAWMLGLMLFPTVGGLGYYAYRQLRPLAPQKAAEKATKDAAERQKTLDGIPKSIQVYQNGSYAQIFMARLPDLKEANMFQPMVVMYTLPLFLMGLWVFRRGIIQDPGMHRALLRKGLVIGAIAGIPLNVLATWVMRLTAGQPPTPPSPLMLLGFFLATFGRPLLSMSYACGLGLLFLNPAWRRRLLPFAAVGRTALSNYLLQTVVCTTIFYGYGGGLFVKVNLLWLLVLSLLIYALEIPLSNLWLRYYRFGPMEWVWRVMTYGKAQLVRREQVAAALSS